MFMQKTRGKQMAKKYRDFESAREFVSNLNLKGVKEWNEFCKSGERPHDIPSQPHRTYREKGWVDWKHFLNNTFLTFESARNIARSFKLKNAVEWAKFSKSGERPHNIPSNPQKHYANDGWKGWGDWLGTGNRNFHNMVFVDFIIARNFVRKLKLKSYDEWRAYCKSGNKPEDIPQSPNRIYKNQGWISFGDWLGTGRIATYKIDFLSFQDARSEVRKLAKIHNIKNWIDWQNAVKMGLIPKNIPAHPNEVYSKNNHGRNNNGKKV